LLSSDPPPSQQRREILLKLRGVIGVNVDSAATGSTVTQDCPLLIRTFPR